MWISIRTQRCYICRLGDIFISPVKLRSRGYKFCASIAGSLEKAIYYPKDGDIFYELAFMECLKYHFEPLALKKDGSLDMDLVVEILPAIKGQPLYRKFGAFHSRSKNAHPDAKMLNINHKPTPTEEAMEIQEILDETGKEIQNPETKEAASRNDYHYFLIALDKVYVDTEKDYKIIIPNPRRKSDTSRAWIALECSHSMLLKCMAGAWCQNCIG